MERSPMASWPTWLGAGMASALMGQTGAGFLLLMVGLGGLPWLVVSVVRCVRHPPRRPFLLPKVLAWGLAVSVAAGVHVSMATRARAQAQRIVEAVEAYHARHGEYPRDLSQLGITLRDGSKMGRSAHYGLIGGHPYFSYMSTLVAFDRHVYDFELRAWTYVPD